MTYQEENSTGPFATVLICMLLALAACASSSWWLRELVTARQIESLNAAVFTADQAREFALSAVVQSPCFNLSADWDEPAAQPIVETAPVPLPPPLPIREQPVQGVGWQVLLSPEPGDVLPPTSSASATNEAELPQLNADSQAADPVQHVEVMGQAYAVPVRLQQRLSILAGDPETREWANQILAALDELVVTSDAAHPSVPSVLAHLRRQATSAERQSHEISSPLIQSDMRRVGYAIERRLALWDSIYVTAARLQNRHLTWSDDAPRVQPVSVVLQNLDRPAGYDPPPAPPLDAPVADIYGDLIDSQQILQKLEAYELTCRPSLAREVAGYRTMFATSVTPEARRLDEHIESHYRNANFRVAVTETLLDRMLPQPEPFGRRVNDYVVGVPVHGVSTTMTRLNARLVPDPHRFHLLLEARGVVQAQTAARSAPATLYSRVDTQFLARKELIISRDGLWQAPATATADNDSRLLRVRSDYDEVPLIGSLIRKVARDEHNKRRGEANREVEGKVAAEARGQFDRQVTPLVSQAETRYQQELLWRCDALGMQATPIELQTSDKRLTARIRFAADDQLAAHTPRPRAPSDSLLSMQLHESAINNMLQQLELDGQQMSLREVYSTVAERLGAEDTTPPAEIPADVMVTFAPQNSLQVHFTEGAMRLTIALSRIEQQRNRWTNLVVRAYYEPQGEGLKAELVRSEGMELIGDRINTRSQIILRGVFAKVLDNTRTMKLVPQRLVADARLNDLEVTQLHIDDGWLGVAVGPKQAVNRVEDDHASLPRWRVAYLQERARWR